MRTISGRYVTVSNKAYGCKELYESYTNQCNPIINLYSCNSGPHIRKLIQGADIFTEQSVPLLNRLYPSSHHITRHETLKEHPLNIHQRVYPMNPQISSYFSQAHTESGGRWSADSGRLGLLLVGGLG